jgi:phosphate transport system substrate-binding protein
MNLNRSHTILALTLLLTLGCNNDASKPASERVKLQGSGASFPAPLYMRWFQDYSKQTPGVTVDYQAKGSGAGIKDLINETVDFAASDAAMTEEEIAQVKRGVVMLPMTAGKIVLAFNLPDGPKELKLSREAYAGIFSGKIAKWDDPVIAKCNEGVKLPSLDITVIVRSDSSGTTYVLSSHLSAISPTWKESFGIEKSINWPSDPRFVKGPKNDGVTALIKQTPGAIGYIEYGFAKQTGLPVASLENQSGKYVAPTAESGLAALASATSMPENLVLWLPDPQGDGSYPIVSYTWLLCYKDSADPAKATALKELVRYCMAEGQKSSESLGYIPLPDHVKERVLQALETATAGPATTQ